MRLQDSCNEQGFRVMDRARAAIRSLAAPSEGIAIVWFAITATVFITCVAVVIDTGQIWINRRMLQNAADAAALAGVQQLPEDPGGARQKACEYAKTRNAVPSLILNCESSDITIDKTYVENDTIKVTVHKTVTPLFGAMFGWKNVVIDAKATALIGGIAPKACVFPLAQTPDLLPLATNGAGLKMYIPTLMKIASNKGVPLALEVDDRSGARQWEDVVASPPGCNGETVDGQIRNGEMAGKVNTALESRQNAWTSQGNCLSPDPTIYDPDRDGQLWNNGVRLDPTTCYRIVKIPVLDVDSGSLSPSGKYPFAHIALFYIGGWCDKPKCTATATYTDINSGSASSKTLEMKKGEIWGYYISLIVAGNTDYRGYDGYGPKVAVLVE